MAPAKTTQQRSDPQRLTALEQANQIRSQRAVLKRQIRTGQTKIQDVLAEPPKCTESAKVTDLLMAVPGIGRKKLTRILNAAGVSAAKRVGGLTARQVRELAAALPG